MEFEVVEKEHATTTEYHWLTVKPNGGGPEIHITVARHIDHTTGHTEHEVTAAEGTMPDTEEDMEAEENAIEYVKQNIDEILQGKEDKVAAS